MTVEEIYVCIDSAIAKCKDCGDHDLAERLDDALHLGSSGLEILGAIGHILKRERIKANNLIGEKKVQGIIEFIESSYGLR